MAEKSIVLVVDDTPDNLTLLSGLLKEEYTVKVANSGEKALEIAASTPPPDLILLDIMMPEMDGYTVCQKLKENVPTRNIPVLFISALSDTFDIVKAFAVGGVDYITKPFQPPEVKARVKTHLELYNTRRELQKLLSTTLTGSVKMMIELLSLTQPLLLEQAARIRRYAHELIQMLAISPREAWNIELATMLIPVGCLGIPQDVLRRRHAGQHLSSEEIQLLEEHTRMGAEMIDRIPRLEKVAAMIRNQTASPYLMAGDEDDITYIGSTMLHMLLAFDTLAVSGKDPISALEILQLQPYPLQLLEGLRSIVSVDSKREPNRLPLGLLQPGMVLAEDLTDEGNNLIMASGSELSDNLIRILKNFATNGNCRCKTLLVWECA